MSVTTLGVTNAGVAITNGNITYTSPPNFAGLDSFQYTVSDGYGSAATGSVTIAVGDAGTYYSHVQITPVGQQFVISFHGVPLHDYVFEGTGNLTTGVWTALQTTTLDVKGSLQLPANSGGSIAIFFDFGALPPPKMCNRQVFAFVKYFCELRFQRRSSNDRTGD